MVTAMCNVKSSVLGYDSNPDSLSVVLISCLFLNLSVTSYGFLATVYCDIDKQSNHIPGEE
jgi:hypothetical protein